MEKGKGRSIIVGMSGGVDSSLSLILLKKHDWNPIGVSLRFGVWNQNCNSRENTCCTDKSIEVAKQVCEKYGCEHVVLNVSTNFHEKVIKYFINTLNEAKTPNPCIICNRYLKFFELFEYAHSKGIDYIATGHYAKILQNKKTNQYFISKPKDKKKDQSYYLALLPSEWLKNIVFPLSDYSKEGVYKLAKKEHLGFYEKVTQSQDFCFVSDKTLGEFIDQEVNVEAGNIINSEGEVLGHHVGLANYTIGQRKNIGLSGGPYYVFDKDIKSNSIVVTNEKEKLFKKKLILTKVVLQNEKAYFGKIKAKIRYQHKEEDAKLEQLDQDTFKLTFKKPQMAATPGQYAVFYYRDNVVGSGEILKSL